jgi:hypothetical protein
MTLGIYLVLILKKYKFLTDMVISYIQKRTIPMNGTVQQMVLTFLQAHTTTLLLLTTILTKPVGFTSINKN